MPQPPRTQQTPPTLEPPPFNPAVDPDFAKRFEDSLAKDDAVRAATDAAKTNHPPPTAPSTTPSVDPQPKPPAATPLESKEPVQAPTETPPSAIPDVKRSKTPQENLVELRKRAEGAEKTLKDLQTQLEAAKTGGSEAEKLRKENEELHNRFAVLDLSMDPKFQAHYDGQINPALEEAKELAGPEHAEAVEAALKMPIGPQRYKMLADLYTDLEPWQAERLKEINHQVVVLERERTQWLGKAKETRANIMAQQQEQFKTLVTQAMTTLDQQLAKAADTEHGFMGFIPGDQNKADVEKNVSLAKAIFTHQLPVEDMAKAAIWAAAAPEFLKQLSEREAEVASLKETIEKLKGATPSPGGGASGEAPSGEEDDGQGTLEERILRRAGKSGLFER